VLQSQQFERVGGNHTITTDVRVIAATNRDLEKMVEDGEFRSDLYYRLSGFTIQLAPLRDRPEDLPPLLENYLSLFSKELNKDVHGISPEAMDVFLSYSWPGNVRELQNVLKQTLLRSAGNVIIPDFIPDRIRFPETAGAAGGHDEAGTDLRHFVDERFEADSTNFVCECSDASCAHRVEATLEQYEEVRADGATFLLVPGHEQDDIERVIDNRRSFHIVEKMQETVRETVERLNPRAEPA
jgi:two-component system nitrogen regulation response regulator GlnG